MTALEVLHTYWGYDGFRPMQEEIIHQALEGRDVLAILPTGGGKSVCFQVPCLMREGIGHAGIDDLVDGNALGVFQDGDEGLHVILVGMGDEPEVHVSAGFLDAFP
jgi:hypothetical protein